MKAEKCDWARSKVEYFGHVIGSGTMSVPEARVSALKNFVRPGLRNS